LNIGAFNNNIIVPSRFGVAFFDLDTDCN